MNENENMIMISSEGLIEAIRAQERIAVVERLIAENKYLSTGDIAAVLNIKCPERSV